ncbi:hypothetical protein CDAR_296021 [Caerostris darwini]|uniref:Uncharacterized protein n=1 Tax=Caerostris darwini TaxID=1538125 RepID=A0AAV4SWC9_9ARAC|nr:hypothetical protein CDAR_296021 [Caerostris darwini]
MDEYLTQSKPSSVFTIYFLWRRPNNSSISCTAQPKRQKVGPDRFLARPKWKHVSNHHPETHPITPKGIPSLPSLTLLPCKWISACDIGSPSSCSCASFIPLSLFGSVCGGYCIYSEIHKSRGARVL